MEQIGNLIKVKLVLIVISLFFYSCHKKEKHIEYYSNGNTKLLYSLDSDNRINGMYKMFYPNGKLEAEIEYKSGLREGKATTYYVNGKVEVNCFYKNDKLNDSFHSYYDNGNSLFIAKYCNDTLIGSSREYHNNSQLHKYKEYFEGKVVYEVIFDSLGTIVSKQRSAIISFECDSISLTDSLIAKVSLPGPIEKGEKVSLFIDVSKNDSNRMELTNGEYFGDSLEAEVIYYPKEKGIHYFKCYYMIVNKWEGDQPREGFGYDQIKSFYVK